MVGPKEGEVGHMVQFTCESSPSNPPASFVWNINGRPFDELQQLFIRGKTMKLGLINSRNTESDKNAIFYASTNVQFTYD